jgi:hypothetical protein
MVVLVLLGLMAGVVGLAWRPDPVKRERHRDAIAEARHRALATGTLVRLEIAVDGRTYTIAALPDGRLIAPDDLRLDPLTGMPIRD